MDFPLLDGGFLEVGLEFGIKNDEMKVEARHIFFQCTYYGAVLCSKSRQKTQQNYAIKYSDGGDLPTSASCDVTSWRKDS